MAGALLLAILLVSASACPASARDLRGAPPAGAAPALTAHTLAAAEAAAAAPLALAALDALDPDDLRAKAAALGRTPEQLRALVATSTAATFERDAGAVRYRCDFGGRPGGPDGRRLVLPGQTEEHEHAEAEALAAGPAGDLPGGAFLAAAMAAAMPDPGQPDPDVSEVFSLHSRPGANHTLYLDFTGHTTTGTLWNDAPCQDRNVSLCYSPDRAYPPSFVTPPFSMDGDPAFSSQELAAIVAIWRGVSEDYWPFGIDVTTEEPSFSLANGVGVRVVIGGSDQDWFAPGYASAIAGGVSYMGVFGDGRYGAGYPSDGNEVMPSFVFSVNLGNSPKAVWEAASHEAGHSFGLDHHGRLATDTEPYQEYYTGHGDYVPIMGAAYTRNVSQWSHGEYAGATRPGQDDVAVILGKIPLMDDDHGDSLPAATPLAGADGPDGAAARGAINSRADVDAFSVAAGEGQLRVSFTITDGWAAWARSDLDARITVYDGDGRAVAYWDDPAGLLQGDLPPFNVTQPGTYYLTVEGVGQGDNATVGRSNYGSLGAYRLTVRAPKLVPTSVRCADPGTIQLPRWPGSDCAGAKLARADLYTVDGPGDVTVTPALPQGMRFAVGSYSFDVAAKGGNNCTVKFSVEATADCGSAVACKSRTRSVELAAGSCDGAKLAKDDLFSGGFPQRVSPALPDDLLFPPGKGTTYTVTSADGLSSCAFTLTVRPCAPACAQAPVTLPTAPGKCTAARLTNASVLLDPDTIGGSAAGVVMLRAWQPPGERRAAAIVRYPGGLTARVTCPVTVVDGEPPALSLVEPDGACAYPQGGSPAACYSLPELAAATDNCRAGAWVRYAGCSVASSAGGQVQCYFDTASARVCVDYPAAAAGGADVVARADVIVSAVDAAGNESPRAIASLFAHAMRPDQLPTGCEAR